MSLKSDILSVSEAAAVLGVTTGRIRQLLIRGRLIGQKLNERAWAVSSVSCDEYARTRQPETGPRKKVS